ncbi:hypothetical protein, partial [Escherichia coli]|uniref:hypothetical protein n=1 Tax=Escherichia coli TaxID=562 RepID=UPI00197AFD2D
EQSGFFAPKKSPIRSEVAYRAFAYEAFWCTDTHERDHHFIICNTTQYHCTKRNPDYNQSWMNIQL